MTTKPPHTAESLAALIAPRVGDPTELARLAAVMNDIEACHRQLDAARATLRAEIGDALPILDVYEIERACGMRAPKR